MKSPLISCRQASALLSMAQERRLAWREKLALKVHLWLCEGCARLGRQLDFMRAALRRYRDRE